MATPIFEIPEISPSQSDKTTTINEALRLLESVFASQADITVTADFVLTDEQHNEALVFNLTGTPSDFVMALQPRAKMLIVRNETGAVCTVEVDEDEDGADGDTVDVADGSAVLLYSDGTNVVSIGSAAGALALYDLADVPNDATAEQILARNAADDGFEWIDQPSGGGGSSGLTVTTETANYTADIDDADGYIRMNVGSANTFTVPPNSSVAYGVGTTLTVEQAGAGVTTITEGSGVTINSRGSLADTAGQYAVVTLVKVATDTWTLTGDLA